MSSTRKRYCVYCGSSPGHSSAYLDAADSLGKSLAENSLDLVYGGASIGLMGEVADSALKHGASAYGVMPKSLADKEIAHEGLTELHITSSMHDRKELMADLADGFIALPGGLGTLEELFEIWTWAQLGFHNKPVAVLNVDGFYDPLIQFLAGTVAAGFVRPAHHDLLIVESEPQLLIDRMIAYVPTSEAKVTRPSDQR